MVICQLTLKMAKEIDFENRRISNFDLDLGSGHTHTVVHHSSTSTYIPNFIGIGKTFFGRTDMRPILLGRFFGFDLKIALLIIHPHPISTVWCTEKLGLWKLGFMNIQKQHQIYFRTDNNWSTFDIWCICRHDSAYQQCLWNCTTHDNFGVNDMKKNRTITTLQNVSSFWTLSVGYTMSKQPIQLKSLV